MENLEREENEALGKEKHKGIDIMLTYLNYNMIISLKKWISLFSQKGNEMRPTLVR